MSKRKTTINQDWTLPSNATERFKAWALSHGWVERPAKGPYQALSLKHPERKGPESVAIFYTGDKHPGALTTTGAGEALVEAWAAHLAEEEEKPTHVHHWSRSLLDGDTFVCECGALK